MPARYRAAPRGAYTVTTTADPPGQVYPEEWRNAATDSEYLFYLTPGELEQMNAEVHEVLLRWFALDGRIEHPDRRPAGSAPVEALLFSFPIEPSA